jgi:hypothetical protein
MAKVALVMIVVLVALGFIRNGISLDNWRRMWTDLVARPEGPMAFRFLLQPIMAAIAALKDGIKDARTGRSPYFWTILSDPGKRRARLSEGLVSTAQIMVIGMVIDTIYQFKVFHTFYPGEAVNIAILLAFLPYLLLRGPIARIARHWVTPKPSGAAAS